MHCRIKIVTQVDLGNAKLKIKLLLIADNIMP